VNEGEETRVLVTAHKKGGKIGQIY